MNTKMELSYAKKQTKRDILYEAPGAALQQLSSVGAGRLDGWQNMLIFGDNLTSLRLLWRIPSIRTKVTLIYIDPPFSTNQVYRSGEQRTATVSKSGKDTKAYEDRRVGSGYIEFLRKRLILLREMLGKDGSIYVHIDWKMGHYVKVLMDEVFGQERFINDIARVKCNPKNFDRRGYGNIHDKVLFYSKTEKYVWNDPREDFTDEDVQRLFPRVEGNGRRYTTTPLHAPGETKNGPTGRPWKGIEPPRGRHWRARPQELEKLDRLRLIEWSSTGNPRKKIYADEVLAKGKKRQDIWPFKDPPYPLYPTQKNLDMLKMIILASSNPDDLVLDCFAGSGAFLVAAEETGRRWIGIDSSPVAFQVAQERVRLVRRHSAFALYDVVHGETHRNRRNRTGERSRRRTDHA